MKKVKEQLLIREKEVIAKIEYRKKDLIKAEAELEEVQEAIKEFNGPGIDAQTESKKQNNEEMD